MVDEDDLSALAGEYVLGTLAADERAQVLIDRAGNPKLDAEILWWEEKFASLALMAPDVAPPMNIWRAIEKRISIDPNQMLILVRRWRAIAIVACLVAIIAVGAAVSFYPGAGEQREQIAVLQKDPAAPAFAINMNIRDRSLHVHINNGEMPSQKTYELWLITDAKTPPKSLGILTAADTTLHPDLSQYSAAALNNSTFAISLEPPGGSPTGHATGPVISTGKFI